MSGYKRADGFYSTAKWGRVRKQVLIRDDYTCVFCRYKGESEELQCDHILPRDKYPQIQYHMSNLRTLCRVCHTQVGTSLGRGGKAVTVKFKPKIGEDGFPLNDPDWR